MFKNKYLLPVLTFMLIFFGASYSFADSMPPVVRDHNSTSFKNSIKVVFNEKIYKSKKYNSISISSADTQVSVKLKLSGKSLIVTPVTSFVKGQSYYLSIPKNSLMDKKKNSIKKSIKIRLIPHEDNFDKNDSAINIPQLQNLTPISKVENSYNIKEIAKESEKVLFLKVFDSAGNLLSTGSGFIISSDGSIVTNFHVIEGGSKIKAVTEKNESYDVSKVLGFNIERDIAILKLDTASSLPYVKIGKSSELVRGEEVIAIGSPLGLQNTVSTGIVSGIRKDFRNASNTVDIQISAPISHGSSGGALFNTKGEVVGITYAGEEQGQNLNYAISIDELRYISTSSPTSVSNASKTATTISYNPPGSSDEVYAFDLLSTVPMPYEEYDEYELFDNETTVSYFYNYLDTESYIKLLSKYGYNYIDSEQDGYVKWFNFKNKSKKQEISIGLNSEFGAYPYIVWGTIH